MKSKLFKQHKKEQDQSSVDKKPEGEVVESNIEVEDADPGVASAKSSKMIVILASTLLVTLVIYFIFFKGQHTNKTEKLEEVNTNTSTTSPNGKGQAPAAPEPVENFASDQQDDDVLSKVSLPSIPKLPTLPDDPSFNKNLLPILVGDDTKKTDQNQPTTNPNQNPNQNPNPGQSSNGNGATNGGSATGTTAAAPPPAAPQDPRRSPIVVESGGQVTIGDNADSGGGIVVLNEDPMDKLKSTKTTIVATMVKDRTVTITQGKMMSAVLETAINTEIPGSVRGIISRDVYAEAGNNILIPKGSRLYGSYSTQVVRGQGRVEINWTRLIRPDGVDLAIGFVASDQFGRAGISGDVDNKYGPVIANSLLTSVLAVGGAIAAERLSGGNGSSTVTSSPSTGTTTTSGTAASQVATNVSQSIINTVGQITGNALDVNPVITVAQGTKMTIIVNGDMTIPPLKSSKN